MIYALVYRWRRLKSCAHLLAEIDYLKRENRILRARLEACERDRLSRPAQGDQ